MLKVHFMGIGGSGISACARMAKALGFQVSGCDLEESPTTYRLRKEGIPVTIGHNVSHLEGADLLVHTSAVFYQSVQHPEFSQAKKALIWEEFMAKYLQRGKFVIAVSGTHGKGTTTAMLARVLETAGMDPTVEVGANLLDWGKLNYRLGKSKYFVCEADEFRDKFLLYRPEISVITSIEMDHPEYFRDLEALIESFKKFVRQSKTAVINLEDQGCQKLIKEVKGTVKVIGYKGITLKQAKLKLPGKHIRSDAGAVWAVARLLGLDDSIVRKGLENFWGLERRFEYRGEREGAKIYDDYAHHPTAVKVNIVAAREMYPKRKICVIFQPHMYSRLEKLFFDFVKALKEADKVVITDVYTRRESGIMKPSGKDLALAIGFPKATYVGGNLENVANFILRQITPKDIILVMGAGDIYKVSDLLLRAPFR